MSINENNKFQLIDDYLKGGMGQDEIDSFRAFMQSDKDLALDTSITMELEEASTFAPLEAQLRDTLISIRKADTGDNPEKGTSNKLRMVIVAALLGLATIILLSIYGPYNKAVISTEKYHEFAMVEPLELSSKSDENTVNLIALQSAYNEGKYVEALPKINTYLKAHPLDLDVLLAKGIALTATGEYQGAHRVFAQIAALNPRVKKYLWYDAVAFVKEGSTEQARLILTDIYNSKSYNYEQARDFMATFN